jgi:hypothetical protein
MYVSLWKCNVNVNGVGLELGDVDAKLQKPFSHAVKVFLLRLLPISHLSLDSQNMGVKSGKVLRAPS